MASKVEICGVNTSKLPRYRDREMQEMLEAIKAGDERMRDEFIRGNLRLVLSVIQKFSARGENPDDLFQGLRGTRADEAARRAPASPLPAQPQVPTPVADRKSVV